jgi:hypothetical protein
VSDHQSRSHLRFNEYHLSQFSLILDWNHDPLDLEIWLSIDVGFNFGG